MLWDLLEYMKKGRIYSTAQLADWLGKDEDFIKAGLCYLEEKRYIRPVVIEEPAQCGNHGKLCKGCKKSMKKVCCLGLWEVIL